MKKFLLIFTLLTSYTGYGAVDSLIVHNSTWQFLSDGTNQGTAWYAPGFSNLWSYGPTILGYGDADTDMPNHNVGYVLDGSGNKNITTYFRNSFTIDNPGMYGSLVLGLICDDGAVVYLNGVEIYRQNMPSGAITYTTPAVNGIGGTNERLWTDVTLSASQLIHGKNVVAVEIHQNVGTSSDIAFNFRLAGNVIPPVNDSLIVNHSDWKLLSDGTNQGTAWFATGFNDSPWLVTGTTILGYGDVDTDVGVPHQVGYVLDGGGNKNITTYFRKTLTVANAATYASLALSLICDDGAVIYLNGVEIYRQNMPTGTIIYTTPAVLGIGNADERAWTNVTLSAALLVNGTNVFAVEIHQNSGTSSDMAFNLLLKGSTSNAPPTVTRGPYLQMLGTNSVVVRWQTATATNSKVSYGLTNAYLSPPVTNSTLSTEHEISITGLVQDTKYFYQIGTLTVNIPSDATTFFKTALPAGTTTDFTVWATGDFGTGTTGQTDVRNAYSTYAAANLTGGKADFWIWLGDNAYGSGTPSEYTANVFNIYPSIFKNTPVFPAVGNHDYANVGDAGGVLPYPILPAYEYFNAFSMPTTGQLGGVASTTKRYYSYNYGNVHFIVLDSYGVITNNITNPMYLWLQSDLAANTKKWTVCYFHHPPYSMGTHNSDTEPGLVSMRQFFVPLLETYHVDLVLSGHSHVYERSFLLNNHYGLEGSLATSMKINSTLGDVAPYYTKSSINGIGTVYAVCGNSGQGGTVGVVLPHPLPPGNTDGFPHDAMPRSLNGFLGSMILTFRTNEIEAKFLTSTGTINDNFKIVKNSCVTGVTVEESMTTGNWHTTSTWACGTVPIFDSIVKINAGHVVTLDIADTDQLKKIYVFGMLRYLNNKKLKLKN